MAKEPTHYVGKGKSGERITRPISDDNLAAMRADGCRSIRPAVVKSKHVIQLIKPKSSDVVVAEIAIPSELVDDSTKGEFYKSTVDGKSKTFFAVFTNGLDEEDGQLKRVEIDRVAVNDEVAKCEVTPVQIVTTIQFVGDEIL